jgi:hypothetical protein
MPPKTNQVIRQAVELFFPPEQETLIRVEYAVQRVRDGLRVGLRSRLLFRLRSSLRFGLQFRNLGLCPKALERPFIVSNAHV